MPRSDEAGTLAAFGATVRSLRLDRGWSIEELAHRAGLSVGFVGGLERGTRNPTLLTIGRLASALGLTPAQLLMWV